ncbi:helix-turn-helix domain-containing protein [Catellatospora vulcania]|uniref:helix-turn-helix domain-containing protein n=1 Tax=Catellatospora vulcania TaxID=1460450 RepID=UPI0012D3728F|nr:helix-turn-helix transcriptional regulator [Catellatospora vulcania]
MDNPTIQRRRLGHALRRAREAAGRTQEEAGRTIDAAATKISRMELGQSGIKLHDLNTLLDFYGLGDEPADALRELARAGRQRGRWSGRNVPDWFRQYVDLEAAASEVRWYQSEIVPGIMQTEDYIRAMSPADPGKTDDHVALRKERQELLTRDDAPDFAVIISESALHRQVGGIDVMHAQLHHLARAAADQLITLQVLPFNASTYTTSSFGFTLLRFEHDAGSDVVYLEDYTNAYYLDDQETARVYSRLWSRLSAAALGPRESVRLIEQIADALRK